MFHGDLVLISSTFTISQVPGDEETHGVEAPGVREVVIVHHHHGAHGFKGDEEEKEERQRQRAGQDPASVGSHLLQLGERQAQ